MRLLLGVLVLAAAAVYVLDLGGARQPMVNAYFGAVRWALSPVVESFQENITPTPSPSPSAVPTPTS